MAPGDNLFFINYSFQGHLFNRPHKISQSQFYKVYELIQTRFEDNFIASWGLRISRGPYKSHPKKVSYYLVNGGIIATTPESILLFHEHKDGIKSLAELVGLPLKKRTLEKRTWKEQASRTKWRLGIISLNGCLEECSGVIDDQTTRAEESKLAQATSSAHC